MLLAIDAGNTNITFGIFEGEELVTTFHITTKVPRTSDEYGMVICELMKHRGMDKEAVTAVILASAVPGIMHSLTHGVTRYLGVKPIMVGAGSKTGIRITAANPKEIGAERIADAVAAYELYGGPVLVLDFDTATTYDLVLADGSFTAGVTCPGLGISANALWKETAKLPEIEIRKPASILAKETVSSMQAGLVYGCIGQTEYIVRKMKEEAGVAEAKVIATGGLGTIIAKETACIDVYDPMLTLKGLRFIYEKCRTGKESR